MGVIIIAMYIKRNRKEKVAVFLNNPYYHDVAGNQVIDVFNKCLISVTVCSSPSDEY